jgi:hypothetical protein
MKSANQSIFKEEKDQAMIANISGNINKSNNHISPQLIKHKEYI